MNRSKDIFNSLFHKSGFPYFVFYIKERKKIKKRSFKKGNVLLCLVFYNATDSCCIKRLRDALENYGGKIYCEASAK